MYTWYSDGKRRETALEWHALIRSRRLAITIFFISLQAILEVLIIISGGECDWCYLMVYYSHCLHSPPEFPRQKQSLIIDLII